MTNNLILEELAKREKIISTFDKNYLLEAGAGAGKTTIIVQRIINQILNTDIDPANIVAITFTKAAATELAERIQAKAMECLKEGSGDIDKLKSVDRIFTGTIHSFCDVILREMPFDANLTPGYEIIEDGEEFYTNIWYNFLRDRQKDYKETADSLAKFNIDYLKLRTRAMVALANPDIKFMGYDDCNYNFIDIDKEFEEIKNKYGHLSSELFKKQSNLQKLFKSILDDKKSLEHYLKAGLLKEFAKKELDAEFLYSDSLLKKYLDNEYQDDYVDFLDGLIKINSKSNNLAYNKANELINMVADYKKDNFKNKLTFNDLLYKASKLIRESNLAREHFKNKYKVFYIDEFQDTDPMQAELILNLTNKDISSNDNWNELEPIAGSLFVVGDPKQSIYRFRRADISTYNQVKDMISKHGQVVELDINFRSSNNICDFVQTTFKRKAGGSFGFDEDSSEVQAGFKRILSDWDDMDEELGDKQLKGVYGYTYPEKEDQNYVANIVKDVLEGNFIIEKIKDDENYINKSKKVEYSDILILTKANLETGLYLKAFKDMGIPALLSGEKLLGNTREVMNLFILIDAIIDYRDNINVVSALRNSFYIDFDSIDLLMEESKYLSSFFFNLEKIKQLEHPSFRDAFLRINHIIKLSRELSPIAFIERIIEDKLGIYDLGKDYNEIELRDANSALRQTVEILKSKKCSSIYEIREELKVLVETQVRYELPITEDESKHAIRIMNIHKAKGLEANIVILVGANKKRGKSSFTHYVEKDLDGNIGFMVHNSDFGIFGPNELVSKVREEEFLDAEVDRLLYVAATRAKTCLIVANCDDSEKGFLYPISANIEREISTEREIVNSISNKKISRNKENELKFNFETRLRREVFLPSYIKATPSQFDQTKGALEVKKGMAYKEFKYTRKEANEDNYLTPRGNVFGTIVHRAIELLITKSDRLKNPTDNILDYATKLSIKESIEKLDINRSNLSLFYPYRRSIVEELLLLKEEKGCNEVRGRIKTYLSEYVMDILNNFINNPQIIGIFNKAVDVFTELPFTIFVDKEIDIYSKVEKLVSPDVPNKPILINGTIDLVIKDKSGDYTIIDYKSDTVLNVGSYTSQLIGYKILFEEILKSKDVKVSNLFIYSTFNNELIGIN